MSEICELFEKAEKENRKPQEEVFELLSQLQELGHPPDSLMKHIQEKYGLTGPKGSSPSEGMPPGMQDLFANMGKPPSSDQNDKQD